ncbi:MAG: hypothetical protein MRY83_03600 [Flavobacteriales bacterium]|nr:hypothetical protein [Flavobacteriales bacterium]
MNIKFGLAILLAILFQSISCVYCGVEGKWSVEWLAHTSDLIVYGTPERIEVKKGSGDTWFHVIDISVKEILKGKLKKRKVNIVVDYLGEQGADSEYEVGKNYLFYAQRSDMPPGNVPYEFWITKSLVEKSIYQENQEILDVYTSDFKKVYNFMVLRLITRKQIYKEVLFLESVKNGSIVRSLSDTEPDKSVLNRTAKLMIPEYVAPKVGPEYVSESKLQRKIKKFVKRNKAGFYFYNGPGSTWLNDHVIVYEQLEQVLGQMNAVTRVCCDKCVAKFSIYPGSTQMLVDFKTQDGAYLYRVGFQDGSANMFKVFGFYFRLFKDRDIIIFRSFEKVIEPQKFDYIWKCCAKT